MDKPECWKCEHCKDFRCEPPKGECPLDIGKRYKEGECGDAG